VKDLFKRMGISVMEVLGQFAIFCMIFVAIGWVMKKTDTSVVSFNLVKRDGECVVLAGPMLPKPLVTVEIIDEPKEKKNEPEN